MKLATFVSPKGREPRLGVLTHDETAIVDVARELERTSSRVAPELSSMQALIEGGQDALDLARGLATRAGTHAIDLSDIRLLAPLPLPVQIRDCMCFEEHLIGSMQAAARMSGGQPSARQLAMHEIFKQRPIYYKANRFATAGPDTVVHWPPYSSVMDYELEMACILGRGGRDIARGEASAHVFGFTIFNDLSARDTQRAEMECGLGPSKSKDFDNANVFGPWIVTADAFDPYNAVMTVRVNGEVRSTGSSSTMTYKFEDLIAFISRSETLHAGEILCSGTVGGGCGLEQGTLIRSGDVVELEIKGLGKLKTTIISSTAGVDG